jgi:hypothetical protein
MLMTLQFVPEDADPYGIVATLVDALAPGSYLAVSHPARDDVAVANAGTAMYNQRVATPMTRRTEAQIARFFEGLGLVDPGLVPMAQWRPDHDEAPSPDSFSPALCGLARKP